MRILLSVGSTPTGVGIVQEDDKLRAFSACCGSPIHFTFEPGYDFYCDNCKQEITSPPCKTGKHEMDDDSCEVGIQPDDIEYMRQFIRSWTHYKDHDFHIEVMK